MKPSDFKVGDVLYFVPTRRGAEGCNHVVIGIGRKWVTAGPEDCGKWGLFRFDPETMYADGGKYSSPGVYYMSEDEYKTAMESEAAWGAFFTSHVPRRPKHITKADILKARELLGLA